MKKSSFAVLILMTIFSAVFAAEPPSADEDKIARTIHSLLPGETITGIKPTPIAGLYEVSMGPELIYMSADGRYIFRGDLMDMEARVNISEDARTESRRKILGSLTTNEFIEFSPEKPKRYIYVFTDVDCSYCRLLHGDVPVLNKHGVGVRYLAFPRCGVDSRTYETMQAIWCAEDLQKALTDAKNGVRITSKKCKNPVENEYLLGQKFGVRGTPGIYLDTGDELPGYVPPDKLLKIVGE
jgi:thiol:disulfide interchange protein DsbC